MLASPGAVVVAASSVEVTTEFFAAYGLASAVNSTVSGALYEQPNDVRLVELRAAGRRAGAIRVVEAAGTARDRRPTDDGPLVLDLYVRDLAATLATVEAVGHDHGPVGEVPVGSTVMRQCRVLGPDGVGVVLLETGQRRRSLLDEDPARSISEVHSVLWNVPSVDVALASFAGSGLTAQFDATFPVGDVSAVLGLDSSDRSMRMAMLCDDAGSPTRLELVEWPGIHGEPYDGREVRPGVVGLTFDVDDIDAAADLLSERWTAVESAGGKAVRGSIGGVSVELWEKLAFDADDAFVGEELHGLDSAFDPVT